MSKIKFFNPSNNKHRQKGVATVLLVTLVGVSVMLATAYVALNNSNQVEASATTQAQTNAQSLSWAGVSAYNTYLLKLANSDLGEKSFKTVLTENPTVNLGNEKQKITALIESPERDIVGCESESNVCQVTAVITGQTLQGQAANSISATFSFKPVVQPGATSSHNLTGNTFFTGSTTLAAEPGVSTVTLNVDGLLVLGLGFSTKGISELNINSTKNVTIDCGITICGDATINVTARGYVHLINGRNFGDIRALGNITLGLPLLTGARAKSLETPKSVTLYSGSAVQSIDAGDSVLVSGSTVYEHITSNKHVELLLNSTVNKIQSLGYISISASTVNGAIETNEYVHISLNSKINGSIYALGQKTFSAILGNFTVYHTASSITGDIYAHGNVRVGAVGSINNVYRTGSITKMPRIGSTIKGSEYKLQSPSPSITPVTARDFTEFTEYVIDQTTIKAYVDVRVYKDEANYIFTRSNGFAFVYLNNLKNEATGKTYIYKNGQQYIEGEDSPISDRGFYVGSYNEGKYAGALCLEAEPKPVNIILGLITIKTINVCTSEIVGYLPRVSVESGVLLDTEDFKYGSLLGTWHLRSLFNKSSLDNAAFAPGIMYFEGEVHIHGAPSSSFDSSTNALVNTILAEGELFFIGFSPKIYSPFSVLREGVDKAALVCDRPLKDTKNNIVDMVAKNNGTSSNKYLRPTNLCKSETAFITMSLNQNQQKKKVLIDGEQIDKLELGEVALMANGHIHLGSCMQVYGDVLTRKEIIHSTDGCLLTKDKNILLGHVTSAGKSTKSTIKGNHLMAGTNIVVPGLLNTDDEDENTNEVKFSSNLEWAKNL